MARWYIIHAYSGFENKVRDAIIAEAERKGLAQLVEAVEVPTETVTEVKRGKKVQVERKFMPGYVLAKLSMNDDIYHLIKNTAKVTGFLGPNGKPQAISDRDAARYFGAREQAAAAPSRLIAATCANSGAQSSRSAIAAQIRSTASIWLVGSPPSANGSPAPSSRGCAPSISANSPVASANRQRWRWTNISGISPESRIAAPAAATSAASASAPRLPRPSRHNTRACSRAR